MLLIIVACLIVLNAWGQRPPDFFHERDYEYPNFQQRRPHQGGQFQERRPYQGGQFQPRAPYQGYQFQQSDPYQGYQFQQSDPYQGGQLQQSDPYQGYQFQERHPYQGAQLQQNGPYHPDPNQNLLDTNTKKPIKIDLSVFEELDEKLKKYNKYEEFKDFTDELKEKTRNDPSRTVEDELKEVLQWSKNLDRPPKPKSGPQMQSSAFRNINFQDQAPARPSPGMSAYWGEHEKKQRTFPTPGPHTPRTLTGEQVMNLALKKFEKFDGRSTMEKFPEFMNNLPKELPTDFIQTPMKTLSDKQITTIQMLPKMDDYNSPIRWVSLDSNNTRDGLAKVTDPRTGRNQQLILNETIFVPIIDYNVERLGLTSTTPRPATTTDSKLIKTVARHIDFKHLDERDWLAYETALGGRNEGRQCDGDACQSRCKTLGCESLCKGDTCAAGCIGDHCNTYCKGPGCLSMCIGKSCTAKCEGMSCDARCRGEGCEAGCRSFSCLFAINGRYGKGGGSWNDHYPQYDDKNIRNTQY